ncbi:MAG: hypothetical protein LBJ00_06190 [Planctomycetaceae bacterium]|jgi:flagellin|nr:hypothetical protein [Planctomycetaceae bacterium]
MAIYFNTNLPETRGLLAFDRTTSKINDILQRLETGYRINSGKDDPTGLIKREGMRLDMKGLQVAINNSVEGQNLLAVSEKAMGSIANLLTGDPSDTGIIGLLSSGTATSDQITNGINQLANTIDSISRTTIYNGKQVINGAYDYNTITTEGGNKINKVKVTSADTSGVNPAEFTLTVGNVAQKAGVQLNDLTTGITDSTNYEIMLTDNEGRSVKATVESESTGNKISLSNIIGGITSALQSNPNINLAIDPSDILSSKNRGENQNVTINVAEEGGGAVDIGEFVAATDMGSLTTDGSTSAAQGQIKVKGQDWSFTGLSGTVVTDNNKISVYSDSINFSALMEDAVVSGDNIKLKVSGGTSFQLGKDISSAGRYNLGIATINSNNLVAKDGTTLAKLRGLDYSKSENVDTARQAITEFASQIATERGRLGTIQKNVLVTNQNNLEDQLAIVTESEAAISNTDVAFETSRLARQELIANSAMSAILYARSFSQFAVSSLF